MGQIFLCLLSSNFSSVLLDPLPRPVNSYTPSRCKKGECRETWPHRKKEKKKNFTRGYRFTYVINNTVLSVFRLVFWPIHSSFLSLGVNKELTSSNERCREFYLQVFYETLGTLRMASFFACSSSSLLRALMSGSRPELGAILRTTELLRNSKISKARF